jgi:hypothetical protein
MRKLIATTTGLVFLLFALIALAQNTSNSQSGSSAQSGAESGTAPASGNNAQTANPRSTPEKAQNPAASSGTSSSSSENANATEGCVVREESDYFLVPQSGTPIRLSGNQASQHLGERVKVKGNESVSGHMGPSNAASGGVSGNATGGGYGNTGNNTSMAGMPGSNAQTGTSGSIGSSSSSANTRTNTGSSPMSTSGNLHAAANHEIVVDRIDTVASSCPAHWNSSYNTSGTGNNPQ